MELGARLQIVLAVVTSAAFGAALVQGLHAQAKPKAYQVTELEIIDAAAFRFGSILLKKS